MAFIDIDDTIREVHGYSKQGVAYGYCGVKGGSAQLAALSSPTCAPVIAAARLIADAVATARVTGQVMVRADSGYYRRDVVADAVQAKAWFSVTAGMDPAVTKAIAAIGEDAWTTIAYPRAIFDEAEQRWICEAQVAQTTFTAFTSHPKKRQVTCRLVVRRVQRLNQAAIKAANQGQERCSPSGAPRVHHQQRPVHDRRRRAPPRPRHHRTGHNRAQRLTFRTSR